MLSERRQTQKEKYHAFSHMHNLDLKNDVNVKGQGNCLGRMREQMGRNRVKVKRERGEDDKSILKAS
jgi:hypothetical protein